MQFTVTRPAEGTNAYRLQKRPLLKGYLSFKKILLIGMSDEPYIWNMGNTSIII
jgi:hypothetical protein